MTKRQKRERKRRERRERATRSAPAAGLAVLGIGLAGLAGTAEVCEPPGAHGRGGEVLASPPNFGVEPAPNPTPVITGQAPSSGGTAVASPLLRLRWDVL
jgi:hypothetical protein